MKSFRAILLIFIVFAFACSSCNKSDTNPLIIDISLKLNGTLRSSGSPVAVYYQSSKTLQVSGIFNAIEAVSFTVPNVAVGPFDIAANNLTVTYSPDANFLDTYFASSGTITITTLTSTLVAGTFQFLGPNAENVIGTITEGKFQAQLALQP
jgi:hypothetical protein